MQTRTDARPPHHPPACTTAGPTDPGRAGAPVTARAGLADEEGSMVSEYGLVAVLGATIAGVAISWAKGGAVVGLLGAILAQLRALIGA